MVKSIPSIFPHWSNYIIHCYSSRSIYINNCFVYGTVMRTYLHLFHFVYHVQYVHYVRCMLLYLQSVIHHIFQFDRPTIWKRSKLFLHIDHLVDIRAISIILHPGNPPPPTMDEQSITLPGLIMGLPADPPGKLKGSTWHSRLWESFLRSRGTVLLSTQQKHLDRFPHPSSPSS